MRRPSSACLAGGNVTSFTELTAHLDKEWTVYGLQPRGLDSILVPHSTISAAVESYIRMIDKIYGYAAIISA